MSSNTTNESNKFLAIYHEKQTRQLCALHALNNLFQDGSAFSKNDLDNIANQLAPNSLFNPHMSPFGFGNYDINVIQVALQNKNYEAVWFNKSKSPNILNFDNIFGFILNIPNPNDIWRNLATLFTASKRHWIAIKRIDSLYHNFDSKLKEPVMIGNESKLVDFLTKQLIESNSEIFVIITKEIAMNESWFR